MYDIRLHNISVSVCVCVRVCGEGQPPNLGPALDPPLPG